VIQSARALDDDDPGIDARPALGGAVGGAVVDQQQLPVRERLLENAVDRAGEDVPPVEGRQHDRDGRHERRR
jgi:hypothetical protein